jgi:D-3-phosphoglycerate dehydrogenase
MASLPRVRVVGRYGVGLDNIDLKAAEVRHVAVVNVPDYCISEVADHALGLILALTRGIVALDRDVHNGGWDFQAAGELRRTSALQLGVIGIGRIGSALACRASALGFKVVATDPARPDVDHVPLVSFSQLLRTSDVISLHVPLDETTFDLLDARALAKTKRGVFIVNTSRGRVINQQALAASVASGQVAGAGLDVFESEPLPAASPLRGLPRVVLTPHTSFFSRESIVELKRRVAAQVAAVLTGTRATGDPE